jgi:hypothetical protein
MRRGISEPPDENPAIPVRTCGCAAVFVRAFARKRPAPAEPGSHKTPPWREMDSNDRSLAKSRGSRQVDILQILAGRPSGYPTVGHCGDVRFRALVKGSMAWLLCLPVGQASSLASSCCSTLFCSLGLRQVFRRGTNGSNPVSSSGESICEPHFLPFNRLRWTCKQRATIGRSAAEATAARFSEMTSLTSRSLAVQPGRVNFSLLLLRAFSADWPPRWRRGRGA